MLFQISYILCFLLYSGVVGDSEREGVIPNSFKHIFSHIARSKNTQFLVCASYLEIYQENVRDLLSPDPKRKLEVRERNDTGVYVKVSVMFYFTFYFIVV